MTTTALVAMAGAVTDEITVTGVVGFGLQTTEGTAAVAAGANGKATTQMVTDAAAANGGTAVGALANDTVATADDLIALDAAIAAPRQIIKSLSYKRPNHPRQTWHWLPTEPCFFQQSSIQHA